MASIKVLFRHFPEKLKETAEESVRIVSVPGQIQNRHLPSMYMYMYTSPLRFLQIEQDVLGRNNHLLSFDTTRTA
jgi:hypothetical protein